MVKFVGIIVLVLAVWRCSMAVNATDITGVVQAEGKTEASGRGAAGNYKSRAFKFLETIDYAQLKDFVVYLETPIELADPSKQKFAEVEQINGEFIPHILPVAVGTVVRWPNRDDIFHNVFSFSEAKRFDLDLYKGDRDEAGNLKEVLFDKPGRVDIFCSIHKSMHSIVLVLPNRHFAKTDAKGRFTLPNVPPGEYRITAWHERMPPQTKTVRIEEGVDVTVDFTLGLKNLPKL